MSGRRRRAGALLLCPALLAPTLAGLWGALLLERPFDVPPASAVAGTLLGLNAVAAALALLGAWLLTSGDQGAPPGTRTSLLAFAALREAAALASLAIIFWAPALRGWQVSFALAIPEVFFVLALCRVLAGVFAVDDVKLATNTRRFGVVYAVYRFALLLVWALPGAWQTVLTTSHRITGPMLTVVLLALLLLAERHLRAQRSSSAKGFE